jgi:hypothetical protein
VIRLIENGYVMNETAEMNVEVRKKIRHLKNMPATMYAKSSLQ